MAFLVLYWKQLLLSIIIAGGSYFVYEKVKDIGYQQAKTEDAVVIKNYEDAIVKKINAIQLTSTTLASESRDNALILTSSINTILKATKGKSLVIVKDGGCVPSQTFSDTFNKVNKQVNENMKGVK